MKEFAETYPIPFAVAKDRQVPKLVARTDRILDGVVSRVEVFRVSGPTLVIPPARFRPGSLIHVVPGISTGSFVTLPPAVQGLWCDVIAGRAVLLQRSGSDLIDGTTALALTQGQRRRLVAPAAGVWSSLAS